MKKYIFSIIIFISIFFFFYPLFAINPIRITLSMEEISANIQKNDIIKIGVSVESVKIVNGLSITIEFKPDYVEILKQGIEYLENSFLFENDTDDSMFLITALADSNLVNISTVILGRDADGVQLNGMLGYLYFRVIADRKLATTIKVKELLINESNSQITAIPIDYNDDTGSLFILTAIILNLNGLRVYPNPFIPTDDSADNGDYSTGVIFDNCTEDAIVDIYTLSGRKVNSIGYTNELYKRQWFGNNNANEQVASGIYLYKVSNSSGEFKVGKLVLIR